MSQYLLAHHRVCDAGNHCDGAAAFTVRLDIDVAYREVGQGREQDAEALKTRLSRCA